MQTVAQDRRSSAIGTGGWFALAAAVLAVGIWVAVAIIPNTGQCPEGTYPTGFDFSSCATNAQIPLRVLVSGVGALVAVLLVRHGVRAHRARTHSWVDA